MEALRILLSKEMMDIPTHPFSKMKDSGLNIGSATLRGKAAWSGALESGLKEVPAVIGATSSQLGEHAFPHSRAKKAPAA